MVQNKNRNKVKKVFHKKTLKKFPIKFIQKAVISLILFFTFMPMGIITADDWYGQEAGYFTLFDEDGAKLTVIGSEVFKEDEYISIDNKHYSIYYVDKEGKNAFAKFLSYIDLPEFEEIQETNQEIDQETDQDMGTSQSTNQDTNEGLAKNQSHNMSLAASSQKEGKRSVLLYCTHSDESYVPSDGKSSIPTKGGIFDVAESFKKSLEKRGVKAVLDKTPHEPHDAGAYRRSRQTAMDLIRKNMPVAAVFDIHRDAVPKEHYDAMINGQYMSRVRIVIGRSNQNRKANEELAHRIKAISDKAYPGLIKDIFIGRGEYNQELSPRSLLFEFGTHEISKEAAEKSTDKVADVVDKAIFGGIFKSGNQAENQGENKGNKEQKGKTFKVKPISQEKQKGASRGIIWFVLVAVIGFVAFTLISKSKNEIKDSIDTILRRKNRE